MEEKTIDAYIALYPSNIQGRMNKIRKTIHETVSNLEETISWSMPTFKYKKKNLIHFAGHKNHIGIYPGSDAISHFSEELKNHSHLKGAFQIPNDKEVDYELIRKIALFNKEQIDKR